MDKEVFLRKESFCLLGIYIVLGFLDVISIFIPVVIVSYGIMTALSIAYIVSYFCIRKEFDANVISVSFIVYCLFFFLSSAINQSSMDRFFVALFAAVQCFTVALNLIVLKKDINRIIDIFIKYIPVFTLIVALFSFAMMFISNGNGRLEGITPHPNALGSVVAIANLCIIIYIVLFSKRISDRIISVIAFALLFVILFATGSRTALLSFIASGFVFLVLYAITYNRKLGIALIIAFAALALLIIILFPRSILSGLSGRDRIWKVAIESIDGRLLFGFGGNTQAMYDSFFSIGGKSIAHYAGNHLLHNIYLQVLCEYGLVSFIGFAIGIITTVLFGIRKLLVSKNKEYVAIFTILIFTLIHDLAESSILYIGGPEQITFMFMLSALYADYRENKRLTVK